MSVISSAVSLCRVGPLSMRPHPITATKPSKRPNVVAPSGLAAKLSGQAVLNRPAMVPAKICGDAPGVSVMPFSPVTVIICVQRSGVSPVSTASRM
ncbi:hypothetical protein [Bradyrhizobium cytisi]|uniref:hypothetical protein n=1 Tax=Bradyrhizobium cytisi TaxID=515489 RepID=UPI001FE41FA8|nr:hypothetical protein [Bradyrhizobium cytisi]